jgi:hypothetical protein
MNDISRRSWGAAVAVTGVLAAAALVPSFAEAAAFAKPPQAGPQGKAPPARDNGKAKAGAGEGIVQSVSADAVVLRELDGSTVSVPVVSSTQVFVDGQRASLREIKAGFVASGEWKAGRSAQVLRAFDPSGKNAVRVGVVESVSSGVLVVTGTTGTTMSIPVNAKTHVLLDGKPATLAAVKTGYTVVISAKDSKGDKPAHELRFLRPG